MNSSNPKKALIVDVKENSLDDGPGIRTLIFFKGCPLKCVWCHNPETKYPEQELLFDEKLCIGCGDCKDVCKVNAIELKNSERITKEKCTKCMECVDACPSSALKIVGRFVTVGELYQEIMQDELFYKHSSGGVTFSGGEPTLCIEFISELAKKLKESKIHINIETNGMFNCDIFEEILLPYLDIVFFDIKFIDKDLHKKYTGKENDLILNNFLRLQSKSSIPVLPRVPLIPEITATEKNLKDIANFLKENNVKKLQLLQYNPLWIDKAIGLSHKISYNRKKFMDDAEKELAKQCFSEFDTGRF